MVRITERLYLTADRKRVVGENDRSGAFLFAKPGDDIADDVAKQYGLTKTHQPAPQPAEVGRVEAAAQRSAEVSKKRSKERDVEEVLDSHTVEELLSIADKGGVEVADGASKEELIMAILRQSGHEKEADARDEKKREAENKMGAKAPNKLSGIIVPPEAKRR